MDREFFIKLDYRCNNNCIFCSTGKHEGFFEFKEVADLINSIDKEKYDILTLSGGEITLRTDFFEILNLAQKSGFRIRIQTNARRFSDEKFLQQILKYNVENYLISFHACDKESFEIVTKSKGSFDETYKGIKALKKYGQFITTNTVVSTLNYKNLPEIASLLVDLQVDVIKFVFIRAFGRAEDRYQELCPKFSGVMPYIDQALKIVKDNDKTPLTEGFPFCQIRGNENVAGELLIPNEVNFNDPESEESNFSDFELSYHAKSSQCSKCNFDRICRGPWREYILLYGDEELCSIRDVNPTDVLPIEVLINKMF